MPAFDATAFAVRTRGGDPPVPAVATAAAQGLPLEPTTGMVIYLNGDGLWPLETGAVPGVCALTIRSVSDLEADVSISVTLTATSETEAVVPIPVVVFDGALAAWQDVSLPVAFVPGVVEITASSHPDLRCRITVLPDALP